ncbi:MAG: metallophosphoesterase [Treponema sp.]|nr:metallophosphoesterase [Treponema sp.]
MKYCCSDLHGCFDEFMELLKRINFTGRDTMYILGDTIDRGPKPVELLTHIYENDNIIPLMGNHEEFLLDYADNGPNAASKDSWQKNNGEVTRLAVDKLHKDDPALYRNIMDDMKTWDMCIVLDSYILSHAGYNALWLEKLPSTIESLNKMKPVEFLWSREEFYCFKGIENYITIFGHTPVRNIRASLGQKMSDDIWICPQYEDKIGIDGAAAYGGQLNCVNLDTLKATVIKQGKANE